MKKNIVVAVAVLFILSLGFLAGSKAVFAAGNSVQDMVRNILPNGNQILANQVSNTSYNQHGVTLYRTIRECATGKPTGIDYPTMTTFGPGRQVIHFLQVVDLDSANYYNYTCQNRYQEQCIDDGSFDGYYDEVCSTVSPADNFNHNHDHDRDQNRDQTNNHDRVNTQNQPNDRDKVDNHEQTNNQNQPNNQNWTDNRNQTNNQNQTNDHGQTNNQNQGQTGNHNQVNTQNQTNNYNPTVNPIKINIPKKTKDKILYRVVRDCGTKKLTGVNYPKLTQIEPGYSVFGRVQKVNLAVFKNGSYNNYTCASRYQEQCINDGSFDSYYDEWCVIE